MEEIVNKEKFIQSTVKGLKIVSLKDEKLFKIVNWIEANHSEILNNIGHESIEVYKFLKSEFLNTNVEDNYLFQYVYSKFYGFDNARITKEFKILYFQFLELNKSKTLSNIEIKAFLKELREVQKGTVQFSFITKLMNLINDESAIYDNEVREMFSFTYPDQADFDVKIAKYFERLEIINDSYKRIIDLNLLSRTSEMFDQKFAHNNLSEVKRVDFIFWSAGKLKRKKGVKF